MTAKSIPSGEFLTRELTIANKSGIHARPAASFVKVANRFSCDIIVEKDGEKINGKSIMGLMMLAAGPGSKLTVHCQGDDCDAALDELADLARIALTPEEEAKLGHQLSHIIGYIEKLKELNVDHIEATAHAAPLVNV